MTRFGAAVARIDERVPGSKLPLLSVSQTRGVLRRSEISDKPPRAESLDVYKICRQGDIVFNKMSIRAGAMGVAHEDGLVTYHYEVMRPRPDADARYVVYLMKSEWFTAELIARERGIGAGDQGGSVRTTEVPFKVLRTIDAYLPSPSEQRAISDFLDRETAQIDTLIAKQEQLIETLRERRSSFITQATDIGVPIRLRRLLVELRQGWSPNCDPDPADGVLEWGVLKVGCSNSGTFRRSENKRLPDAETPRPELAVRNNEIIMSRSNTKELVGAASVVHGYYPRLLLSDLTYGLTLSELIDPDFVAYGLANESSRQQISAASKGTSPSMQKISQRDVLELEVRVPALDSQRESVRQIEASNSRIDTLILKAEQFVAIARERRAALITAAVTGQIDVRK